MRAERMPQADRSLFTAPLQALMAGVVRFPRFTLLVAAALTAAALWLTFTRLGFRTSRADLLNPNSDYNQRWLKYTKEFGDKEDVVAVVEGPDATVVAAALDDLGAAIAAQPNLFHAVLAQIDLSRVRSKGLHYVSADELRQIEGFLDKAAPLLGGDWGQLNLANLAGWMQSGLQAASPAERQQALATMHSELTRVAEGLAAALDGEGRYKSPWPEMSAAAALGALDSTRLMTDDGRLGFVLLRLTPTDDQNLAQNSQAIDALRRVLAQAQSRHPRVKMGLTGLPIIENDEMRASQSSTIWATLLSFGGVFGVMVLGFGGFRHSAVVMVGLLVGTVWTCGAVAATVGHVTLLSAAFGSILFGLGIDYGIALLSGYLELRAGAAGPREALLDSATRFSPGITTAALTSAAAFFMVGLTEFTGVAQLGLIAGAGIMLCWLAMMTVMPALLTLVDRHQPAAAMPQPLELGGWLRPLLLRPRLAVAATIAFSALLALGIRGLWYDYNLLNLQPDGLESVALEHKLLNETNFSACFALSMADTPDELLARKQQFEELPTVERVEEIASLFPADAAAKSPLIARIQQRVARLPAQPPEIPVAPQAQIEQLLARAEGMLAIAPEGQAMVEQLRRVGELVRRTPPAEYLRRMTAYQQALAADLLARLQTLRAVSQPQPPALDDLPAGLTERFIGHSGKMVQKIYARINIWDVAGMEQFVREVRSVDENATGNPMQISEAARHMKRSYEQAAWYTLLGVIPIVLLDFRRLGHAMLAILPAVLALAQLMGLMGGLGMPFNPANMIVLPFLLGVGMDNGVHIVHDFRRQGAAYRQIDNSAALTVLINSLTTTVGFASLMVATHKGLQSLGQALTLGTSFCLLNALLLPNLLLLLNRRRKASGSTTADSATADADAAETSAPLQGEPDPAWPLAPGDDQVAAAYRRDAA